MVLLTHMEVIDFKNRRIEYICTVWGLVFLLKGLCLQYSQVGVYLRITH